MMNTLHRRPRGFTLIELMVVLAIVAILSSIAAPSLRSIMQTTAIASAVNTFLGDLRYARSEALRRGGAVVMCRSDNPLATSPACNTGSGPGGNGWVSGWIIFHDLDGDGTRSASSSDPVLRRQEPLRSVDSVSGTSMRLVFTATGRLRNLSSALSLQFGGTNFPNATKRVVCVNVGGRGRVAGDVYATCAT